MKSLFDKTYDELREAFVRARFAEKTEFGLSEIDGWLKDMGANCTPWNAPAYLRRIQKTIGDSNAVDPSQHSLEILSTHATSYRTPPFDFLGVDRRTRSDFPCDAYLAVLESLVQGGASAYYPFTPSRFPLLIVGNVAYVLAYEQRENVCPGKFSLSPATSRDVERIIFVEWMENRPKRAVAKAFLLREYTSAIAESRVASTRDFDEAVAVSADGTKITSAKSVIVSMFALGGEIHLFPGSTFQKSKILLPNGDPPHRNSKPITELEGLESDDFIREALLDLRKSPRNSAQWWHLFREGYLLLRNILIVDKRFCPSPLPDGGRRIRI